LSRPVTERSNVPVTCSPEAGLAARPVEFVPDDPETGVAYLVQGTIDHGVEITGASLTVMGETEFFGRRETRGKP